MIHRFMLFGLTALVFFLLAFALSGTALLSFLLVYSYSLLLLIPVELCKYSRNLMTPLQNVHACIA